MSTDPVSHESDSPAPNGNPLDIERRLILARALAAEHGMPLGFHDEEDQLDWDRKACAVLRELDSSAAFRERQNDDA